VFSLSHQVKLSNSNSEESADPKKWDGKSHGYPIGYQILFWFVKNIGLGFTYWFLNFVAGYFFLFVSSSRTPQYKRLREVQGYGKGKAIKLVYRNVHNFAISLVDRAALIGGAAKFDKHSIGQEYINEMVDSGTGGFLISCHLGNWEIAGHLLEFGAGKVNVLMYDAEHQKIKESMPEVQQNRSFNIIPIKNDLSHVFEVKAKLDAGELVCLHADRYMEGGRFDTVDFLGKPARFPLGPFALATKLGADVPRAFVYAVKTSKYGYTFESTVPETGRIKPVELMERYSKWMGDLVNKYPDQWYNFYDFWADGKE
jgi:predicted LPLAT superfamily acyltransferase